MPKRNQFIVRDVRNKTELLECTRLDHTYATDQVWQLDIRVDNDDISVRFRTVRLPRQMEADYPREDEARRRSWGKSDCFLVACSDDVILGYLNMRVGSPHTTGWIADLVVGRPFRRRRIGRALLEQAARWGRLHQLTHLMLEMPSKNFPAIQFAQRNGFVFSGFNDQFYANRDIAIFFSKQLS